MNEVIKIDLNKIDSFNNHPFKVNHDGTLNELMENIKGNGLLYPLVVKFK